jgi:hypothetical protein
MSSIIQKVSYKKEDARQLEEKLGDLLGVHQLSIILSDGNTIEGVISEVGKDYIVVIDGNCDTVVPIPQILFFRYER